MSPVFLALLALTALLIAYILVPLLIGASLAIFFWFMDKADLEQDPKYIELLNDITSTLERLSKESSNVPEWLKPSNAAVVCRKFLAFWITLAGFSMLLKGSLRLTASYNPFAVQMNIAIDIND